MVDRATATTNNERMVKVKARRDARWPSWQSLDAPVDNACSNNNSSDAATVIDSQCDKILDAGDMFYQCQLCHGRC